MVDGFHGPSEGTWTELRPKGPGFRHWKGRAHPPLPSPPAQPAAGRARLRCCVGRSPDRGPSVRAGPLTPRTAEGAPSWLLAQAVTHGQVLGVNKCRTHGSRAVSASSPASLWTRRACEQQGSPSCPRIGFPPLRAPGSVCIPLKEPCTQHTAGF